MGPPRASCAGYCRSTDVYHIRTDARYELPGGIPVNEFDRGYRECREYVVAPLYAAIEEAIDSLEVGIPTPTIISYLKLALKACDSK